MGSLLLDVVLFGGLTALAAVGFAVTGMSVALKVALSVLFAAKELLFRVAARRDRRIRPWYFLFLTVDIAVLAVGVRFSSVPIVIAAAIAIGMTSARTVGLIRRTARGKKK